ncbi:pectin esterase [Fulvivirgaceae bacterium PWU4]|uniref:Pectinesterase n=1 Tax=Chryseosolibacter histidini TaxID=2782349 RepID=A0AAP2GMI0_9BACT|nr:pectinesterase family protein [Chryseosolibacter histidini]MBT1695695.1 pectin esterase [Chryseosolibacter histidini]
MKLRWLLLLFSIIAGSGCEAQSEAPAVTYTVALDGSGDFTSLQQAVKACKVFPDKRITIRIKPGTYREKIEVFSANTKIAWIGESAENTVISFDDYSGKGDINTFTSYTVKIMGNDFYAENITFENSAGPVGQAVALHVEADRCVFRNCRFIGNQDTIYTGGEKSRQYFKDCYIEGTTDFIFGAATAVFENCHIHSKKNSYVTAASTTEGKKFGYVFLGGKLTSTPEATKVYLGRPWRNFAKTVYITTELGTHILPEGWHNWNKPEAEQTTFYAEYNSKGAGANPEKRVKWSHQLTAKQAADYTVKKILAGDDNWNPETK